MPGFHRNRGSVSADLRKFDAPWRCPVIVPIADLAASISVFGCQMLAAVCPAQARDQTCELVWCLLSDICWKIWSMS